MAVEARRGCGFRKIGGLYLVSGGGGVACDRLPIPLDVCPTCGHGFKQTRGFTWIDVPALVDGVHPQCRDEFPCPLCMDPHTIGRAGLLWIGEKFYKTPHDFVREGDMLGVSRRIAQIPRGFKVGATWILLAHPKAVEAPLNCSGCGGMMRYYYKNDEPTVLRCDRCEHETPLAWPGIFRVWKPERIEKIVPESYRGNPERGGHTFRCINRVDQNDPLRRSAWDCVSDCPHELKAKGITPVYVPDDDPDHRGSVYDDDENGGANGEPESR